MGAQCTELPSRHVANSFWKKVPLSESSHNERDASFAEELVFDANLQEFAARVGLIVSLELGDKISPEEAYSRIKSLWKQLKKSKKHLRIGDPPESPNDSGESM